MLATREKQCQTTSVAGGNLCDLLHFLMNKELIFLYEKHEYAIFVEIAKYAFLLYVGK